MQIAPQAASGYLYQVRIALYEALRYVRRQPLMEIAVERFDDVSFEMEGQPIEILQTKHHITKRGDLTDKSVDLWKTIGNWAKSIKQNPLLLGQTRFVLLTTALAPHGTAAALLRPSDICERNPEIAENLLIKAGASSNNAEIVWAVNAFMDLTPELRKALVKAVTVIDAMPHIAELESHIMDEIRMVVSRKNLTVALEQLEGWWWGRICKALAANPPNPIPIWEIDRKIDEIQDSLRRDSLPFIMNEIDPPMEILNTLDEMCFVRQLRSVGIGARRIRFAKRDFYRANEQRSYWVREQLILDGEVGRFDNELIEEWEIRFEEMCERLVVNPSDAILQEAGKELYGQVEQGVRISLRGTTRKFFNIGSYHILSDDLQVGWHRDFKDIFGGQDNGGVDGD